MTYTYKFIILLGLIFGFCQCSSNGAKEIPRDKSITHTTAYNDLFLDSAKLVSFLDEKHINDEEERQTFIDFYRHRNYQYAWFDSAGLAEQAFNFVSLQNNYITPNDSSLYNGHLQNLLDTITHKDFDPVAMRDVILRTELDLTLQFFKYAKTVYKGTDINAVDLGWYIPRKKVNIEGVLDSLLVYKGKDPHLFEPLNRQFRQLQEQVKHYLELKKNYTWEEIPMAPKGYRLGDSSKAVADIKNRLQILGDMNTADSTNEFNIDLEFAVKHFQKRHGLVEDGIVGKNVLSELNTPLGDRVKQLLINMERFRWMPARPDSVYLMVNIPEFKLHVYENKQEAFSMKVIVGTAARNTVIFSDHLKFVVFSPYWNIPNSITVNEILPAMRRNPNYLARNNMEITGYSDGTPIIRQKPGGANALGAVKFIFPNQYNIYLHDTPYKGKFDANTRSFSHGCIRLETPFDLAKFLLRNQPQWTDEAIREAMHLDKEKWVTLEETIPVFITYFTAWVDENGEVNFRNDIYGHDEKMAEKLFAGQ